MLYKLFSRHVHGLYSNYVFDLFGRFRITNYTVWCFKTKQRNTRCSKQSIIQHPNHIRI